MCRQNEAQSRVILAVCGRISSATSRADDYGVLPQPSQAARTRTAVLTIVSDGPHFLANTNA